MPLVEVAWADDWVDEGERELILSLAATRGVEPDTPAYTQLVQWLDHKPEPFFFEKVDTLLAATLALKPPAARGAATRDVLEWSTKIAEATGGILHMQPISRAERECIAHIAERLTRNPPTSTS